MTSLSQLIKTKYQLGDVYHMTDVENLDSIFRNKMILSHNKIDSMGVGFTDISNPSVQEGRANIVVPVSGKQVHDYVPLYWGKKTPMVSAVRDRNTTLVFLMFSTNLLAEYDCVITDGNARANGTVFRNFSQIDDLDILNPADINTFKYGHDLEVKRRKQAELLVLNELPLKHLSYIVCHLGPVKSKVEELLATHGLTSRVYIGAGNYYFVGK